LAWDKEEFNKKSIRFVKELLDLANLKIPKWVSFRGNDSYALHVFCEASKVPYAAIGFIKCKDESKVSLQLLLAKSRITPLKTGNYPSVGAAAMLYWGAPCRTSEEKSWFRTPKEIVLD
jgi:hypothetical protein